jgi:hypothetical protein
LTKVEESPESGFCYWTDSTKQYFQMEYNADGWSWEVFDSRDKRWTSRD